MKMKTQTTALLVLLIAGTAMAQQERSRRQRPQRNMEQVVPHELDGSTNVLTCVEGDKHSSTNTTPRGRPMGWRRGGPRMNQDGTRPASPKEGFKRRNHDGVGTVRPGGAPDEQQTSSAPKNPRLRPAGASIEKASIEGTVFYV